MVYSVYCTSLYAAVQHRPVIRTRMLLPNPLSQIRVNPYIYWENHYHPFIAVHFAAIVPWNLTGDHKTCSKDLFRVLSILTTAKKHAHVKGTDYIKLITINLYCKHALTYHNIQNCLDGSFNTHWLVSLSLSHLTVQGLRCSSKRSQTTHGWCIRKCIMNRHVLDQLLLLLLRCGLHIEGYQLVP